MKTLLAAPLAALTILLSACGGGTSGPNGTYTLDVDTMMKSMDVPAEQRKMMEPMLKSMKMQMQFRSDGTFDGTFEMPMAGKDTIKGTWKLDGKKLSMTGTSSKTKKEETKTGTFENGKITIDPDKDGDPTMVLVKK